MSQKRIGRKTRVSAKSLANLTARGRPKGVPNKVTREAKALFSELVDDPEYRKRFRKRLFSGRLHATLEAMAWHYAKGKPIDRVEQGGPGDFALLSDAELLLKAETEMQAMKARTEGEQP